MLLLPKKRLRNGLLTLGVAVIVTVLVNLVLEEPMLSGYTKRQLNNHSSTVSPDFVCTITDNDTVYSVTGDYAACVSEWLFTVDARTGSGRQHPDPRPMTEAYQTSRIIPRCYSPPHMANTSITGACFRVSERRIQGLGLALTDYHTVNSDNVDKFVFVTGISANHFTESLDAIASVQKFMSRHEIIVYDLGLTQEQVEEVRGYYR